MVSVILLFIIVDPFRIYAICVMLMIVSIVDIKWTMKNKIIAAALILINTAVSLSFGIFFLTTLLLIQHIIIFIIFLRRAIIKLNRENAINLFYLIIGIYELSLSMKYLIEMTDIKTGTPYFYITTAFEIIVALYFILFNEKNSRKLKLNFNL